MPKITYSKEQWKEDDHKCKWTDIIVLVRESNKVSNRKDTPYSQLIGIKRIQDDFVKCIVPTIDITDSLRVIGIGLKLLASHGINKIKLATVFVNSKAKKEQLHTQGLVDEYDDNGNVVRICGKRYLNVLFGLVMKTKLKTRGALLNCAQFQKKLSTNQAAART